MEALNYGEGRTFYKIPTIQPGMDWRDQHDDTVEAKKNAEAAAAIYGGTVDQYFTTPNQVSAAQLAIVAAASAFFIASTVSACWSRQSSYCMLGISDVPLLP